MENHNDDKKKYDNIEYRIKFILELLDGKKLNPMINFDECDTEAVENSNNEIDVRQVLEKKFIDFNKIIYDIGC
jgi:hypothetical protein